MIEMTEICCSFCLNKSQKQTRLIKASLKRGQTNFFCNRTCKGRFYTEKATQQLLGQKFGMLTVLSRFVKKVKKSQVSYLLCKCDCGQTKEISLSNLTGGNKSCGCTRNKPLKKTAQESVISRWLSSYKKNAIDRGLQWELTYEQFKKFCLSDCFYCGNKGIIKFPIRRKIAKTEAVRINGIDRVDNTKGYVLQNCVACCRYCNQAKSDMSLNEFLSWINRIFEKHGQ